MAATVYERDNFAADRYQLYGNEAWHVHPHLLSSRGYNHKKLYSGKFAYILHIAWVIGNLKVREFTLNVMFATCVNL